MGRALKIAKYGTAQGITYPTATTVNQPAAAVNVDVGYPNFGSLTDPVYNAPVQTLDASQYLGVVDNDRSVLFYKFWFHQWHDCTVRIVVYRRICSERLGLDNVPSVGTNL